MTEQPPTEIAQASAVNPGGVGATRPSRVPTWLRELGAKWAAFFGVILSPGTLLMTVLSIGLTSLTIYLSTREHPNGLAVGIITGINLIPTAIAGTWIAEGIAAISNRGVLRNKGLSAYRQHKLLLRDLRVLRDAMASALGQMKGEVDQARAETWIDSCDALRERVLAQIEEWSDVVPEIAQLASRIGEITELVSEREAIAEQLRQEREGGKAQGEKAQQAQAKLTAQIAEKDKQIAELRGKIAGQPSLFGVELSAELEAASLAAKQVSESVSKNLKVTFTKLKTMTDCVSCGKRFFSDGAILGGRLCPECRKGGGSLGLTVPVVPTPK